MGTRPCCLSLLAAPVVANDLEGVVTAAAIEQIDGTEIKEEERGQFAYLDVTTSDGKTQRLVLPFGYFPELLTEERDSQTIIGTGDNLKVEGFRFNNRKFFITEVTTPYEME